MHSSAARIPAKAPDGATNPKGTAMDHTWSLGTLVGVPLAILGVLALLALAWLLWRYATRHAGDEFSESGIAKGFSVAAVVGALIAVFGVVWGEYPYNSEYHQWRTTSGTVTQVGSRLLGEDKSTTQRFVVTLAGVGQRSCDDTRCAEVKVGDHLTLTCKRAWQYAGADGYDCNFVEDQPR